MTLSFPERRPFLWEIAGPIQKVISFLLFLFALLSSIIYTISKFDSSIQEWTLKGQQTITNPNELSLFLSVPQIKPDQLFSVFFIDISSSTKDSYEVYTIVNMNSSATSKHLYYQNNSTMKSGSYIFFSTDFLHNDVYTVHAIVNGNVSNIQSLNIRIVHSVSSFGEIVNKLRKGCAIFSGISLICFAISIILFTKKSTRYEQYHILFLLLLAAFANIPFSQFEYNRFLLHSIDNIFRGAFSASNLIAIFCFLYLINGGENLSIALIISFLYIFAESMSELTDDSLLLANFFSSNLVVYMFFFISSLMTKICIFGVSVFYIMRQYFCFHNRNTNFGIFTILVFATLIELVPNVFQAYIVLLHGCRNNAFDFFQKYLVQTITTFILAFVFWPVQITNPQSLDSTQIKGNPEDLKLDVDALSAEISIEVKSDNNSDNAL